MGPFGISGDTGVGGLVVGALYLVLGPGALAYNGVRLALHRLDWRRMKPSDYAIALRCLWWNLGIATVPVVLVYYSRD